MPQTKQSARRSKRLMDLDRDDDSIFGGAYLVPEAIMNDPVPLVRSHQLNQS